jgi:hypothetical protein
MIGYRYDSPPGERGPAPTVESNRPPLPGKAAISGVGKTFNAGHAENKGASDIHLMIREGAF